MSSHVQPRFVADKMLGRLARWLRILGYDVLYGTNFSGRGLLAAARSEGRIVLTRDRRLARRPGMPPCLLVEDDHFRDQLRQVVSEFAIDPRATLFRRCVECNAELDDIGSAEAAGRVPEFVLATQTRYRRCPRCRHLYWEATHVDRVRRELERIFGSSAEEASP
ncbi:MAG: Mut7-C RNAse domain-containing protein [Candidatus Binatia bacterium]